MNKRQFIFNICRNSVLFCMLALFSFVVLGASNANAAAGIQSIGNCTVLDRPGSYVLAHNITAKQRDLTGSGPACILIIADFVTLDLQGYTITGPGTGFGIYSTIGPKDHFPFASHVRNGSVTGFERGIALEGEGHTAEEVRLVGNNVGITVDGTGITVEEVHAPSNRLFGVLCGGGYGHSVHHSEVSENGSDGINLNQCSGSSIIGNTVLHNGGVGILATCPSVILQNISSQNGGGDIVTNDPTCTRSENNPVP